MTTNDPYPEIGDILAASVSGPWDRIVLDAEVGDDWARFRAVAVCGGSEERGVNLRRVTRLRELFQQLRATTRVVASDQSDWTTATFTLNHEGSFEVHFDYAD
jgi:hypothetical protein